MYASHNNNIKYVYSTIKYINFWLIHYAINLYIVSSFIIFSDFDLIFFFIYDYFKSIELFLSSKKVSEY